MSGKRTIEDRLGAPSFMVGWAGLGVLIFLIDGLRPINVNYWVSIVVMLFGVWAFIAHGRGRITTLGLFNFATALFIGYSGSVEASYLYATTDPSVLTIALCGSLFAQAAITAFAWKRASPTLNATLPTSSLATAHFFSVWGLVIIASVLAGQIVEWELAYSFLAEGVAFVGVVLVVTGAFVHPRAQLISYHTIIAVGAFALYADVLHQGTGRLRMVSLACVLAALATARFPYRGLKWLMVSATPIALWYLARDRLILQETLQLGGSEGRSGLESMLSPLVSLTRVIEAQDVGWPLRWGASFLSLPFVLLPESVRPSWVPDALGYDLVNLTAPSKEGTGFSDAATVFGEWVWNFGLIGLLLMIPIVAWGIVIVDRGFDRAVSRVCSGSRRDLLLLVAFSMLVGSVADFVWSGLHTYGARLLTRLPVIVVLFAFSSPRKPINNRSGLSTNGEGSARIRSRYAADLDPTSNTISRSLSIASPKTSSTPPFDSSRI